MAHFLPSFSLLSLGEGGRVQVLFSITRVAVQVLSKPVNCHGTECLLEALAQCRAEGPDRSEASVMGYKVNCGQMRVSGFINVLKAVL
jgi:hypothetical protein